MIKLDFNLFEIYPQFFKLCSYIQKNIGSHEKIFTSSGPHLMENVIEELWK